MFKGLFRPGKRRNTLLLFFLSFLTLFYKRQSELACGWTPSNPFQTSFGSGGGGDLMRTIRSGVSDGFSGSADSAGTIRFSWSDMFGWLSWLVYDDHAAMYLALPLSLPIDVGRLIEHVFAHELPRKCAWFHPRDGKDWGCEISHASPPRCHSRRLHSLFVPDLPDTPKRNEI